MVTYSVEEDRLLLQLRDDLSSSRGPDWTSIKNRFNVEFGRITNKKYTVAMLRNRLARVEKSRFNKKAHKARNRCGICGQLLAGHTCKRIQAPDYIFKQVEVVDSNVRQGTRRRNAKRAIDYSYRTDSEDDPDNADDPDDILDIDLPTEAEISEAFLAYTIRIPSPP